MVRGTPRGVQAAWLDWAAQHPGLTLTGTRQAARRLARVAATRGLSAVVLSWADVAATLDADRRPWPLSLVRRCLTALPADVRGAWDAALRAVTVDGAVRPPATAARPLLAWEPIYDQIQRMLEGTPAALALFGGQPAAPGMWEMWEAWRRGDWGHRRRPGPLVVFDADPPLDRDGLWSRWLRSPAVSRDTEVIGAGEPDRLPVAEDVLYVAADDADRARQAARLAARGWGSVEAGAGARWWLALWDAADAEGQPQRFLAWDAVRPGGPSPADLRAAVVAAGPVVEEWPIPCREAAARLHARRRDVLDAADWRSRGRALTALAAAGGVATPWPGHGWESLDAAGVPLAPLDALVAWARETAVHDASEGAVAAPGILPDAWYPVAVWMGSGDPVDGLAARAGRIVTGSEGFPAPPPGEPVSAPAALDAGRFAPGQVPVPETATALEAYGRCPLQYAWRALGVEPLPDAGTEPSPALVGQWAHAALHRVAGQPLAGRDAARAVADAVAAAVAALPPPRTVLPEAVAAAVSVLVSDLAWLVLRWPAAGRVYGEEPFRLQVDGAFVRGRIDRLEETAAGGVRALDYKSGGQVPPPSVAPSRLQLPLYARAAQERFGVGDDQVEAGYWGIRRAGGYPRRMLPPPFAERWREAVAIVAGIRERAGAGWFLPYPESPRTCEVCDYRIACPVSAPRDKADLGRRHPAFAALWDGVDGAENGDSP